MAGGGLAVEPRPAKGAWKSAPRRTMSLCKPWKLIDNNVKVTIESLGVRQAGGLG